LHQLNPSYFGLNAKNKVGLIHQVTRVNNQKSQEQQYVFGTFSVPNQDFNLSADFYTNRNTSLGYRENIFRASFVYRIQLDQQLFLLPAISAGFVSTRLNFDDILLEDQVNQQTGTFTNSSIDPFLNNFNGLSVNYLDVGVSTLLHHPNFILGLSASRLNQPSSSSSQEVGEKYPIKVSFQAAYEYGINRRGNSFSNDSFLYLSMAVTKVQEKIDLALGQDLQLGSFGLGLNQKLYLRDKMAFSAGVTANVQYQNFTFGVQFSFPVREINKSWGPNYFQFFTTFDLTNYRYNIQTTKRLGQSNY
ncbi:MAG: type IX secretion system membrane protein PorP/SprF, partial [Flavobacteriaceae bacterium]